jgi:hypothetical protein
LKLRVKSLEVGSRMKLGLELNATYQAPVVVHVFLVHRRKPLQSFAEREEFLLARPHRNKIR